jgi:lysyl-tRNA synthetase class 2
MFPPREPVKPRQLASGTLAPYPRGGNRSCSRRVFQATEEDTPMLVDSTTIQTIDYDGERAKLCVRFMSGERYVYVGVPGEVGRSFLDAEGKAQFFLAEIVDRYPYNRLDN